MNTNKYMEKKIIKQLNWMYYGIMALTLIALTVMYYLFQKKLFMPVDPQSSMGNVIQYIVIFDALVTIPLGLYLIKWRKPTELKHYRKLAVLRILLVGNSMPLGIIAFYWLGAYQSMIWVAAISAVSWYFTKPTPGKMEKEMTPEDPNIPTY